MFFLKAKPMWISGKEKVMNRHIVLKADVIDLKNTILYITAAYSYRLTVNGEFAAYGPARTAEGYARVDSVSLDRFSGRPAEITIEASGYNCCSYVCVKQDSFIVAEIKNRLIKLYAHIAESVADNVKIGIENLHLGENENTDNRNFGYTPEEVSVFLDEINKALNKKGRVGHLLDVGHARNNGAFSQKYPVGRWYCLIGKKIVAYHLHQVVRIEGKLKNHQPIEDWFGPMISFASFFYSWEKGILNHAPIFLEVRGFENYTKTIRSFNKVFN